MYTKNRYPIFSKLSTSAFSLCLLLLLCITPKVHAQLHYIIKTIAGTGDTGYSGDGGPATLAKFYQPIGIAVDDSGNIYIADDLNSVIRKINSAGIISTFAGNGILGYSGDGGPATSAEINYTKAVTTDKSGNVYIGEAPIRKVKGGIINDYVGSTTTGGYAGDGGPADEALIRGTYALAVDDSGNLYFSDFYNNVIRKVRASDSIIYTIAGNYGSGLGYSGDGGPALDADVGYSFGIAVDHSHNVYISDYYNNVIRKISASSGIITTIGGTGTAGYSGDGGLAIDAKLSKPYGLAVDKSGNLYIADAGNEVIREILASNGKIYTIAGNGTYGYTGDGGPADSAELSCTGIAIDTFGNIYFTDGGNNVVRELIPVYGILFKKGPVQSFALCENTYASIDTLLSVIDTALEKNSWSTFIAPAHGTLSAAYHIIADSGINTPAGLYYVPAVGYTGTDIFTVQAANETDTIYTTIHITIDPSSTVATITGADSLCIASTTTLSDAAAGGTWHASDYHATIDATGLVTGITAGIDIITYTVSNSCGYITATKTITIDTIPYAGSISGDATVCAGAVSPFADIATGGTWSTTNTHANVLTGYTFGLLSALSTGIDTITYTVANSCGTAIAAKVITIDSLPTVAAIAGASTLCHGYSIILADPTPGGTWSATNTNATVLDGIVTGITGGTDVIQYSITASCGTSTVSKIITVQPYAGSISGPTTLCADQSTPLSDPAGLGTWSISNPSASITSDGTLTGIVTGNDTITYTITNSCGTASVSKTIDINPAANAGIITGDSTVCAGSVILLTDTIPGGHWHGTGDSAVVADGIVAGIIPGLDTITYSVITPCGTAITSFIVDVLTKDDCISLVPNLNTNSSFKVYPNPSTGIFTIDLPQANTDVTITVIDIIGKTVTTKTTTTPQTTIDLSNLPAGNYIIKAIADGNIYRSKITLVN